MNSERLRRLVVAIKGLIEGNLAERMEVRLSALLIREDGQALKVGVGPLEFVIDDRQDLHDCFSCLLRLSVDWFGAVAMVVVHEGEATYPDGTTHDSVMLHAHVQGGKYEVWAMAKDNPRRWANVTVDETEGRYQNVVIPPAPQAQA